MANIQNILVPDIGGGKVDVIEIVVNIGDVVEKNASLLIVESEKASMDIPAPFAGTIKAINVKIGDKLSEGDFIFEMEGDAVAASSPHPNPPPLVEATRWSPSQSAKGDQQVAPTKLPPVQPISNAQANLYAGPAVRRIAREFGIDLSKIRGTGEKNRITKEDVQNYVRQRLSQTGSGFNFPVASAVDFSKYGAISIEPLSKIKKISGANLHRNWVSIPHITQFDDADITDLENYRQAQKAEAEKQGVKLTPIVFVMKAVVAALKQFPRFNASLDNNEHSSGENLVLKKYFHIGVAVDTPNGLVVPVIRDVDQKNIFDLAKELGAISKKAREKGLTPMEMQGGCFTISSLGGIGGTAFTPIINAPEVAILGLSKTQTKPVWKDNAFVPRLMLPLCLSYDHRVIDGADGARFVTYLAQQIADSWK
ncbi:MAG: dihydrolipoyllysine-residue acetyltransferase [Gammaproteobacteria bacterium]|nr:dihydrolipoyllysine-residue acetyltransferase [Gammaproteobacteria bacterium]